MQLRDIRPGLAQAYGRFRSACGGNASILFGMASLPAMLLVGSSIDYTQASARKAALQAAVDAAVLAAVQAPSAEREQAAERILRANLDPRIGDVQFNLKNTSLGATVTAQTRMSTGVMRLAGVTELTINASASARMARSDTSCILTMARGIPIGANALTFNGSPSVSLAGCGMMSNASAACSGWSTNAPFTAAAGVVSGACPNQKPDQDPVPDIFESLKDLIQPVCNGLRRTTTWRPGAALPLPNMIPVTRGGYTEYHVCGDLRIDGDGALNTHSSGGDVVIVIENGDLDIRLGADASATRMTFVLTGDALSSHRVVFPNGAGNGAVLAMSPSIASNNPWRGISVYQDPRLTENVDMTWGPGATFRADGLVYFGPAELKLNGNAGSNAALCTKFVSNSFTASGNVAFQYNKGSPACAALGVNRWEAPPYLLP